MNLFIATPLECQSLVILAIELIGNRATGSAVFNGSFQALACLPLDRPPVFVRLLAPGPF
jgi:hypothetical protein